MACYALISEYIGYKSNKYSNILYLLFWVILYNTSITYYLNRFRPEFKTGKVNYTNFFLLFLDIIGILLNILEYIYFLPVINKGIAYLTKSG